MNQESRNRELEALKDSILRTHGKGSVTQLSDVVQYNEENIHHTGSISLDIALGIGGYPKGRIIEVYGNEACIHGNSFLQYEVWSKGKKVNHKGGTISRLYEQFNKVKVDGTPNQGKHLQVEDAEYYIKSVNHEGSIVRNKVLDVIKTGSKKCFQITTKDGNSLVSTPEHKFLTPEGWKALDDINIGDTIYIHNNTRRKGRKQHENRKEVYVKYHPYWPMKIVKYKTSGKQYLYYRGQESRAVYEAHMNNMSLDEWLDRLNTETKEDINSYSFLDKNLHIHHIDENFKNNNIANLIVVDPSEHGALHTNDRHDNLSFMMVPTKLETKDKVGIQETYDLKCAFPYNNYIAEGIVVHNSGKTTLALHAIAQVQKANGVCGFVDAEHALDVIYAQKLGVQVDNVLLSQPNFGEQALDIVEMMARSGSVDLIVVDSVAALTPKSEIEGEMADSSVGTQARLMSKAMRKLIAAANQSKCTIMFINQIRMKIGVMFGCFHYDTQVNFTDGRSIPIGKVVDEKIKGNVYCINEKTEKIESKPIIDWHDNGKVETKKDFIHIQTSSINGDERFSFTCTPNHKVLTEQGWKEASDLNNEDRLVSKYTNTINGTYGNFMFGVLSGDSHISIRDKNTGSLRLQDNQNPEYINWKLDKLSQFIEFSEKEIKQGYRYDSEYIYELARIKQLNPDRSPLLMLNNYSNLGLAIWIMDNGNLDFNDSHMRYTVSVKRFKNNYEKLKEIKILLENVGLQSSFRIEDGSFSFNKKTSLEIASRICKYVPKCMQYKLPEEYRNKYQSFTLSNNPTYTTDTVEIKEIREASDRQIRNKRKFDISIDGNHNYMVGGKHNGVVVHNSPETTTGGNALKFYASQRLEVRRGTKIEEGSGNNKEQVGNITKVKVVKNKMAPPFRTAEFDIRYGIGIDTHSEILEFAVEDDLIIKAGSWYKLNDDDQTSIGQGKLLAVQWLKDNNEIAEDMKKQILSNRGLL